MKTKLVLFFVLLFVIGCTSTEKKGAQPDDGAIVIDINSALKGEGRSIGDMVESVRIVPLETTEASVLNQFPKSVIVTGNYIFVEDFQQNGVELLMFDKDGKFIKKFQRGNGPGEFNILNNIAYDGKNLYVFDYSKILRYSADGQFIDSKDFDCRMMYMTKFGDGFVAIQRETQSIDHKFKMFKIDSDLKLVAEHILDPFPIPLTSGLSCFEGGDCLILRCADNDVYCCSDEGFKVKYRLDFSEFEYQIPFEKYQNLPSEKQHLAFILVSREIESGKYILSGSMRNSEDYLLIDFLSRGKYQKVFYNRNTGKTWMWKYDEPSSPLEVMSEMGKAHIPGQKNTFFGIILPEYMGDCWQNNPNNLLSAKDIEILKNAKADDNPIIVIYKLKDNL